MFSNSVLFRYFLFFGFVHSSIEQTIAVEKGSDVSIVIDFQTYSYVCDQIEIYFLDIRRETKLVKKIVEFYNQDDECFSKIAEEYGNKILNIDFNIPTSVSFTLQNVSIEDTGKYYARRVRDELGEELLFVTDAVFRTRIGKQVELDLMLALITLNELVDIKFFSRMTEITVMVLDPVASICNTYLKYNRQRECRIKGNDLMITIKSPQLLDQGIYALIGQQSGLVYKSAILYITENGLSRSSPVRLTGGLLVTTTELHYKGYTDEATFGNRDITPALDIIDSTVLATSFIIQKEYFIGGGAGAGGLLLILTFLFICKRYCQRRREFQRDGAGDEAYDHIDVHYYSGIGNQDHCVSESVSARVSAQESQTIAIRDETNLYDVRRDYNITDAYLEPTNRSVATYITIC